MYKRVIDSYLNTLEDNNPSIFQEIYTLFHPEWLTVGKAKLMDIEYIIARSGEKIISPYVDGMLKVSTTEANAITKLAEIIANRYLERWNKIYEVLVAEYNPIENYSMTETRTPNLSKVTTNILSESLTMQKGTTTTSKVNQKTDINSSNTESVTPFNESAFVDVSKSSGTSETEQTEANNNSETNITGTDTNNRSNTGTVTEQNTGTERLTRSGNIGVTTSQQMIQSEIDLRIKNDLYSIIYADVDSILTLSIY